MTARRGNMTPPAARRRRPKATYDGRPKATIAGSSNQPTERRRSDVIVDHSQLSIYRSNVDMSVRQWPRADLRVGDADRQRVVDELQRHYVAGRLTSEELGERVAQALSAR